MQKTSGQRRLIIQRKGITASGINLLKDTRFALDNDGNKFIRARIALKALKPRSSAACSSPSPAN